MPDLLFILVLALVIFGPKKLPEFARQIGKYRAQFKQMQRELTNQIETEMNNIRNMEKSENADDNSTAPASGDVAPSKSS